MLKIITFIGLGSFLGGVARYGVGRAVAAWGGLPPFWGTLAANLLGCFLIGLLYGMFDRYTQTGEHWRLFLTVGFCGGFTTFSTFVHENYASMTSGRFLEMALYAAGSFFVGLLLVWAGHQCVR